MFRKKFFFFSSRRRHTRSKRDWSSDVCSSDLCAAARPTAEAYFLNPISVMNATQRFTSAAWNSENASTPSPVGSKRSEERRVGKEWRSRGSACDETRENKKGLQERGYVRGERS